MLLPLVNFKIKTSCLFIILGFLFHSCDKEEKNTFKMSGYYNITKVEQTTYKNGVLQKSNNDTNIGFLLLANGETFFNSQVDYEISSSLDLLAWKEINFPGILHWDASQNNKTLDIVLEPDNVFIGPQALIFTILEEKKNSKKLLYTDIWEDSVKNFYATHEIYEINLK